MTLGDKQRLFTKLIAQLILWMYEQEYEVSFGDAYRDPRLHGRVGEKIGYGHSTSLHKSRLAIDLNLFKDDVYLQTTQDHKPIGEHWETMHPLCQWGGHFQDGNHYSLKHNGMK